ncbi:cupin domain-containing protein [Rhizobium leguminosarum]|uniref:cupin domain-containing protein n=1 Tax=Rhizobium leguminosarum TaxID=384 RepID=UPI003F991B77
MENSKYSSFDPLAMAARLPDRVASMIADEYLVDRADASCRVFRVYRGVPAHFHLECDEYLYVLSGRGTFWMGDQSNEAEFSPGQLLFFERGVVHSLPTLIEEPVLFLSIDAPRRSPTDVTFVEAGDQKHTSADFMARNADY